MDVPQFENRIYPEASPQAMYLRWLCSDIGRDELDFAKRVHQTAVNRFRGTSVEVKDPHGFILGLHAKGFDVLAGIRALGSVGCIGPAIGQIRTLFEAYVTLRYITETDTEERLSLYRQESLRQIRKMWNDWAEHGDAASTTHLEWLKQELGLYSWFKKQPHHWTGADLRRLAADLGLATVYATLYRSATRYTHVLDIDETYNPFMLGWFDRDSQAEEPHFITNLGCWSAMDVLTIVTFAHVISWSYFGRSAKFLDVTVTEVERKRILAADHAVRHNRPAGSFAEFLSQYDFFFQQ